MRMRASGRLAATALLSLVCVCGFSAVAYADETEDQSINPEMANSECGQAVLGDQEGNRAALENQAGVQASADSSNDDEMLGDSVAQGEQADEEGDGADSEAAMQESDDASASVGELASGDAVASNPTSFSASKNLANSARAAQPVLIDDLTIGGKKVYFDQASGALMYRDGSWKSFRNVTCSVDSKGGITFYLDGAKLGRIDCRRLGETADRSLILELATGSKNEISGSFSALDVAGSVIIQGAGSLLLTNSDSIAATTTNSLKVQNGADVSVIGTWDKACDAIDSLSLVVKNASLRANREISIDGDITVLKGGLIEVDTDICPYCLSTELMEYTGALRIKGGTVLINSTVGYGLFCPEGVFVEDGGILNVKTVNIGVNTSGADFVVNDGTVFIVSEKAEAIQTLNGSNGLLLVNGGKVFAQSGGSVAIVTNDLDVQKGSLRAVREDFINQPAIVVVGSARIADGVEIKNPANGEFGFYMFYNTVMDDDSPASDVLIEGNLPDPKPDPDPNPNPTPDPDPSPQPVPAAEVVGASDSLPATGDPMDVAMVLVAAGSALAAVGSLRVRRKEC